MNLWQTATLQLKRSGWNERDAPPNTSRRILVRLNPCGLHICGISAVDLLLQSPVFSNLATGANITHC
jgi:hypothetical protein